MKVFLGDRNSLTEFSASIDNKSESVIKGSLACPSNLWRISISENNQPVIKPLQFTLLYSNDDCFVIIIGVSQSLFYKFMFTFRSNFGSPKLVFILILV